MRRLSTLIAAGLLALAASMPPALAYAQEIRSYALVQPDATLQIRGREVHLRGIYIPETGKTCDTIIRPTRCGTRAAIALERKIQGFVHCVEASRNYDGSVTARCFVNRTSFDEGDDLGAFLIEHGFAVAAEDAPFEYRVLERIARANHRGVWGFQVDRIN
jgi:endonuclease YncB( thermonuclease family)